MFTTVFLLAFIFINISSINSIKIGKIPRSTLKTNSSISPSSDSNCTNCLCNCFNSPITCMGINCYLSNSSCQLIDRRAWILESDLITDSITDNYLIIKQNSTRFCSCYTPEKILDLYGNNDNTNYVTTTTNVRSIKYISNDDSLIILNSSVIRKLSARNLTEILRSVSVSSDYALSILHNDTKIYIAFAANRSINMYDLNLNFLQTSTSWSSQVGLFTGMFLYNNQILIIDVLHSTIWSIDSLNQYNLNKFFNFSSYNIINATNLFIYQNKYLYIASMSKYFYAFNLTSLTLQQTFSLSVNIAMLFMRYDSNCDRLWFGTQNYTYAPVFDLATNQMYLYQTKGLISRYGIYSIDFDANYMTFYANTNENLRQISIPDINC